MYIGELIKDYRTKHNLSMQDFANISKISKAYIGVLEKIYNPKTKEPVAPTIEKMKAIGEAMGMSLDELLKALDTDQPVVINNKKKNTVQGVRIPILGKVVAGIPLEAITDIDGWEEISPKMASSGEYFALRIKGLSMEPKLHEGDIVIVKRQSDVESGDTAIILVDGEDATVKQIKKTKEGIMLIGLNIDVYPPHFYTNREIADLPVQIIGKVVESRHTW